MLKVAAGATLQCCCVLALFVYALVRTDWLIYVYEPAASFSAGNMPNVPIETAGKLKATFSLWKGCMDVTWYDSTSWSPATLFQSKTRPEVCYDVLEYNDNFFDYERDRFDVPDFENLTSGITTPSTTKRPTTIPGNDTYRTGYVLTVSPRPQTTPVPKRNTLQSIDCPLPPDVIGATYEIDTPYDYGDISFSRVTYSCENGDYSLLNARDYTLQAFCVNGSWTKPPTCTPKDRCLPQAYSWDICLTGRAWDPVSIVKAIGGDLPINSTNKEGFGVFLFPEFEISCDGIIRQWDVYANFSGQFYLSVWKRIGTRYYFIGKNTLQSSGKGLQGFVVPVRQRLNVRRGYIIGVSYDELLNGTNDVVQVYKAPDIDQANPFLDWRKLLHSKQAIMVNVTQGYVDGKGFIETRDTSISTQKMVGRDGIPVVPIVLAYVTGAVLAPIRYRTVQALMVLAALAEFLSIAAMFLFIVFFAKKKESIMGAPLQAAIFLNLFACATAINGVVLLIQEYDCNTVDATYGSAIFIAFAGIGLSAIGVLVLCIVDRRLLTELSQKQYTIVVKPPSALA